MNPLNLMKRNVFAPFFLWGGRGGEKTVNHNLSESSDYQVAGWIRDFMHRKIIKLQLFSLNIGLLGPICKGICNWSV